MWARAEAAESSHERVVGRQAKKNTRAGRSGTPGLNSCAKVSRPRTWGRPKVSSLISFGFLFVFIRWAAFKSKNDEEETCGRSLVRGRETFAQRDRTCEVGRHPPNQRPATLEEIGWTPIRLRRWLRVKRRCRFHRLTAPRREASQSASLRDPRCHCSIDRCDPLFNRR